MLAYVLPVYLEAACACSAGTAAGALTCKLRPLAGHSKSEFHNSLHALVNAGADDADKTLAIQRVMPLTAQDADEEDPATRGPRVFKVWLSDVPLVLWDEGAELHCSGQPISGHGFGSIQPARRPKKIGTAGAGRIYKGLDVQSFPAKCGIREPLYVADGLTKDLLIFSAASLLSEGAGNRAYFTLRDRKYILAADDAIMLESVGLKKGFLFPVATRSGRGSYYSDGMPTRALSDLLKRERRLADRAARWSSAGGAAARPTPNATPRRSSRSGRPAVGRIPADGEGETTAVATEGEEAEAKQEPESKHEEEGSKSSLDTMVKLSNLERNLQRWHDTLHVSPETFRYTLKNGCFHWGDERVKVAARKPKGWKDSEASGIRFKELFRSVTEETLIEKLKTDGCPSCAAANAVAASLHRHAKVPSELDRPFGIVHADLGQVTAEIARKCKSLRIIGARYFFALVDKKTDSLWVRFARTKDTVAQEFKLWHVGVKAKHGAQVGELAIDRGTEILNKAIKSYCADEGIILYPCAPFLHGNGPAEAAVRLLQVMTRKLLFASGVPWRWYELAMRHACLILNIVVRQERGKPRSEWQSRHQALTGKSFNAKRLAPFGSFVWFSLSSVGEMTQKKKERSKVHLRSKLGLFLGLDPDGSDGSYIYDFDKNRIRVVRIEAEKASRLTYDNTVIGPYARRERLRYFFQQYNNSDYSPKDYLQDWCDLGLNDRLLEPRVGTPEQIAAEAPEQPKSKNKSKFRLDMGTRIEIEASWFDADTEGGELDIGGLQHDPRNRKGTIVGNGRRKIGKTWRYYYSVKFDALGEPIKIPRPDIEQDDRVKILFCRDGGVEGTVGTVRAFQAYVASEVDAGVEAAQRRQVHSMFELIETQDAFEGVIDSADCRVGSTMLCAATNAAAIEQASRAALRRKKNVYGRDKPSHVHVVRSSDHDEGDQLNSECPKADAARNDANDTVSDDSGADAEGETGHASLDDIPIFEDFTLRDLQNAVEVDAEELIEPFNEAMQDKGFAAEVAIMMISGKEHGPASGAVGNKMANIRNIFAKMMANKRTEQELDLNPEADTDAAQFQNESKEKQSALADMPELPKTVEEMCDRKELDPVSGLVERLWFKALCKEMLNLWNNGVFEFKKRDKKLRPIKLKVIPKYKFYPGKDGKPSYVGRKVRIVAKGYMQAVIKGVTNYFGVARPSTVKLFFALSRTAKKMYPDLDWSLTGFDVSAAYLAAKEQEGDPRIQLRPFKGMRRVCEHLRIPFPADFEQKGSDWMMELRAQLYGLRSAGRAWGLKLRKTLVGRGFTRCVNDGDECVYIRRRKFSGKREYCAVLTIVDDCLVLAGSIPGSRQVKTFYDNIEKEYNITKQMVPSLFLGFDITRDENNDWEWSHDTYILTCWERYEAELRKYGLWEARPKTPLSNALERAIKNPANDAAEGEKHPLYSCLLGSLMYTVGNFFLEANHPVSILAHHLTHASDVHFKAALHVLAYLRGRVGKRLVLGRDTVKRPMGHGLWCACDADFANARDKKSQTGFIIYYESTPICWVSRKQASLSLSTTAAETRAATEAVKEIIVIRRLLAFMGFPQLGPTLILEDNSAVVTLSEDEGKQNATRLKHVDIRDRFVFDCCNAGIVRMVATPTTNQLGDLLTKTMTEVAKFERLRDMAYNPPTIEELTTK